MKILHLADVPEAIPVVAEWLFNEWGQHRKGNSLEKVRGRLELQLNKEKLPITIVTLLNKTPVGTASLRQSDGIENRPTLNPLVPWLASVYVPEEHRKKGIASELIEHISNIATKRGSTKLYLRTEDKVGFYKNLSWSTLETLNTESGNTTIMYQDLALHPSTSK